MPTFRGKLQRFVFSENDGEWYNHPVLVFAPSAGSSPPIGKDQWFHFDLNVYSPNKEKPKKILRKKISLFGSFGNEFEFQLKGATESNLKLKARLKDVADIFRGLDDEANIDLAVSCHATRECDNDIEENALLRTTYPRGWLYIIHTFWIGNFIDDHSWNRINDLAEFYATDDCDLSELGWIDVTSSEELLIKDGHDLAVFKKRLSRPHLTEAADGIPQLKPAWLVSKTYQPLESYNRSGQQPENDVGIFLRLSRTGIIEVREVTTFRDQPMPGFLRSLLGIQAPIMTPEQIRLHAQRFANALIVDFSKKPNKILPCKESLAEKVQRVRQRYTVIMMSRLAIAKPDSKYSVKPETLWQFPAIVRNFLEGTMVVAENDKKECRPPELAEHTKGGLKNESTWTNELCVFGSERCLIFFEPQVIMETDGRFVNYSDYWRTIIRGIEHTVSVRTTLHLYESYTRNRMEAIPGLLGDFNKYEELEGNESDSEYTTNGIEKEASKRIGPTEDNGVAASEKTPTPGDIEKEIKAGMDTMAETVANALRVLPSVREVSVAASAFRSGHAVDKFDYLNEKVFRFPELLRHIQQNIDEMTSFLLYFKQRRFSLELNKASAARERLETAKRTREARVTTYLAVLAILLAVLAAFYTGPLFLDAFSQACHDKPEILPCLATGHLYVYGQVFIGAFGIIHTLATSLFFRYLWPDVVFAWKHRGKWVLTAASIVLLTWIGVWCVFLLWIFVLPRFAAH